MEGDDIIVVAHMSQKFCVTHMRAEVMKSSYDEHGAQAKALPPPRALRASPAPPPRPPVLTFPFTTSLTPTVTRREAPPPRLASPRLNPTPAPAPAACLPCRCRRCPPSASRCARPPPRQHRRSPRRGGPVRSLAASPAPAVALKPLVFKAPACGSYRSALLLHRPRHALPETAAVTAVPEPDPKVTKKYQDWDSLTATLAGSANLPFLLLQLPQIFLNYRNLVDGNKTALYAVPWLGMLTGLLGNLALVSYFAKKRETEAVIVQTLGVFSTYVVIVQLAMAESMPMPHFLVTSAVVAAGLLLNLLNYIGWLPETLWLLWEDFTTIGGLTVLPQVMWSTFVPLVPSSILPGIICGSLAVAAVAMARMGKLSEGGTKFVGSLSGWTATLLFMWMPVAQMWTNYLNPSNIEGLSAFSMLLAMIGNGLMIPRSVFIRDLMWFTGSIWACGLQGWGNLACMYCCNSISREFFFATTFGLFVWLGFTFARDTGAYGNSSPMTSLKELVFGK